MNRSKPTAVDVFIANAHASALGMRNGSRLFTKSQLRESNPDLYFTFLYTLFMAWIILFVVLSLMTIGAVAILHASQVLSNRVSASVLAFVAAFALAGAFDAVWRIFVVWSARGRYLRAGRTLDETAYRLMKRARFDDGTLLIQLAVGVVFSFHLWSRI